MPPLRKVIWWLMCYCILISPALAGTIVVTNNADSGPGSFRDAILQAAGNGTAARDSIIFSIPDNSPAGRTITLQSVLPELTGNLAINGSSQAGAGIGVSEARILLLLNTAAGDFNFLDFHDCSDIGIYGLAMISTVSTGNIINGIRYVRCHNIQIGRAGMGNYILGCTNGIYCNSAWHTYQEADSSRNLIIQSNVVGLDMNGGLSSTYHGTALAPQTYPLFLSETFDITIGGDELADGNTFFGGATAAIWNAVFHHDGYIYVKNNNFGTKKDGTLDPGNYTPTLFNVVGSGGDYTISCLNNHFHGAILLDEINNYFSIQGNTIWGSANQGDAFTGVEISNCYAGGLIGGDGPGQGNTIYSNFSDYFGAYFTPYSLQTSIRIVGTPGITIKKNITTCNSYYASTIELLQPQTNVPFVQVDSTGLDFVRGKATPNARIDIYLDDDCYACEGKQWIGLTMSNADSSWAYHGNFNAAVVATSTLSDGSTSMFSQPFINNSGLRIKQPSCGKNNGYIKGMQTTGSDHAKWHLFHQVAGNWVDSIVSDKPDLLNAGAGVYYFDAWIGKSCRSAPLSYKLEATPLKLDTSAILINNPGCGKFYGSIKGISLSTTQDIKIFWKDDQGHFVSDQMDLDGQGPGKYKLVVTDTVGGCMDSSFLYELDNQSGPAVYINIGAISITGTGCSQSDGSIRGIEVTGADTYSWMNTRSRNIIGNGIDLLNIPAGSYQLFASSESGCRDSTTVFNVPGQAAPVMDSSRILINADDCGLSDGSITGITIQGSEPIDYDWFNQDGKVISQSADVSQLPSGQYYLTVQDVYNCLTTSNRFTVPSTTEKPDLPDYGSIIIMRNTPASLKPKNPQTGTYFLYEDPLTLTADQQNNSGVFSTGLLTNDTVLYVRLVHGNCESAESSVKIRVIQTTQIEMPNVFSPNHDGRNEIFKVPHPEIIQKMQLVIFNRWGQKIFETTDPYQGWNGTVNGADQPAGTYVWMLNCTDLLDNKRQETGSLVLIR
ncbi:MAG TPA: gliding motility-associated C-terminal domain-containing protein [Puia sp.]|nr:gliding motility-associated C-terminal domain-containing protein [Puia sp.]